MKRHNHEAPQLRVNVALGSVMFSPRNHLANPHRSLHHAEGGSLRLSASTKVLNGMLQSQCNHRRSFLRLNWWQVDRVLGDRVALVQPIVEVSSWVVFALANLFKSLKDLPLRL